MLITVSFPNRFQEKYFKIILSVQEEGDSKEDVEARALLNKFLGATALMTGIEKNSGLSKEFLSTGSSSSKNQRVSTSITEFSTLSTSINKQTKSESGRVFLYDLFLAFTIICVIRCSHLREDAKLPSKADNERETI